MIFGELSFTQIGNLAEAPSYRKNPDGSEVANLRVITTVSWKNRDSEGYSERAEGFRFEAWGPQAAKLAELSKGSEIYIEAEPRNASREPEGGGDTIYFIRFVVRKWWVPRSARSAASNGSSSGAKEMPKQGGTIDEGDIPF